MRLVDEVADVLRDRIYAGQFLPGTPLRQEHLAAELDVSRTPLREALRMLEREGLVTVEPNRGVRVISADLSTLVSAYELREVIDGLAARLAAQARKPHLPEQLRSIIERQRTAFTPWNAGGYTAANVEFHATIIAAADNGFLEAQLPLVHMTARVFTPVARVEPTRARSAVSEHAGIVDAIEQGLAEEAERRARAHIRRTMDSLALEPASSAAGGQPSRGEGA